MRPPPGLRQRSCLDALVLLDTDTGRSWVLDQAGALLWNALRVHRTPAAVIEHAAADDATADRITAFTHDLVEAGALIADA